MIPGEPTEPDAEDRSDFDASHHPIDESMKALLRSHPDALFRLARLPVEPHRIRLEDTAINVAEQRADHVFVVEAAEGQTDGAVYVEYQLQPRADQLPRWFAKAGALGRQLEMPVVLLVVYLEKGDRTVCPDSYAVTVAALPNRFQFTKLLLWEHADRIRSGELWEFAPLLVLCEHEPAAETLRQEVAIIKGSDATLEEQSELFAVALRVAGRRFSRGMLEAIFREELPMIKGATIIDDWIAEGEERGEARGEARGRAEEARRMVREALSIRFGQLPAALEARIDAADAETCAELHRRALRAESLERLDI